MDRGKGPGWFRGWVWGCVMWDGLGAVDYGLAHWHGRMWWAQEAVVMPLWGPLWVRVGWGLAVWGAVAGAAMMVARVRHAAVAYALACVGGGASLIWQFAYGAGALAPLAMVMMGGLLAQLWVSRVMFWRGVLR